MSDRQHSVLDLVKALAGPIVWAAHFFFLYLAEAFTRTGQESTAAVVRWSGIAATLAALAALALISVNSAAVHHRGQAAQVEPAFAFARPLALLSMVAIFWTSLPLFLLPVCAPVLS